MKETYTPLSVFIIAKDEADRIGPTVESVIDWADEVIVVDSGSTDDTREIAAKTGARVLQNDWRGYGPQKQFAESQCCHQWLLNIDADEPVTDALKDEIIYLLQSGRIADNDCWRIHIDNVYPHENKPASWAFSYNQIRLYDRQKAGFAASTVHDSVIPGNGARVGQLKAPIAHRSFRSLSAQTIKLNHYTDMLVDDLEERGRKLPKWRLLTEFPFAFLKAYVIRRYALYGFWGFVLAMDYANFRFMRVAKHYERQLKKQP